MPGPVPQPRSRTFAALMARRALMSVDLAITALPLTGCDNELDLLTQAQNRLMAIVLGLDKIRTEPGKP